VSAHAHARTIEFSPPILAILTSLCTPTHTHTHAHSYDEKSASMLKSQILSQLAESRLLIVLAPIEQTAGPGGRGKDVGEKGTARRATVLKLDTDDEFSRWLKVSLVSLVSLVSFVS